MRKRLLCALFFLSVVLPATACAKTAAEVNEPALTASQPVEQTSEETADLEEIEGSFSKDTTAGQILTLMNDCNGKDLDTAVKMFEEYFGTELVNTATLSQTLNGGPETYYTVYYTVLEKDGLRFNVVNFTWNKVDEKVCSVELEIRNDEGDYAYSELSPLPGVPEVTDQYFSFTNEVYAVCGNAVQSGKLCYDEDSYWNDYEYGDDCIITLELYNYTEEGGNGLVASHIQFSNNSYYY